MPNPERACDHFIESGEWGGTYCKRLAGHDGEHSAFFDGERKRPNPEREDAVEARRARALREELAGGDDDALL